MTSNHEPLTIFSSFYYEDKKFQRIYFSCYYAIFPLLVGGNVIISSIDHYVNVTLEYSLRLTSIPFIRCWIHESGNISKVTNSFDVNVMYCWWGILLIHTFLSPGSLFFHHLLKIFDIHLVHKHCLKIDFFHSFSFHTK